MRPQTAICALVLSLGTAALAGDWPQFRGPGATGVSTETNVPIEWGPEKNIVWKVKLDGEGNGSAIVSNGRVFVTTAKDKGKKRTLRCFDRGNGKELWERTVEYDKDDPTHNTNPYAGTTPAADSQHVVVWHSSAGLYCYDFDGKELWSRDLGVFRHIWGYGTSPILHDGKVFLNTGPGEKQFMTALDLETGKTLWTTDEPGGSTGEKGSAGWIGSWSTPIVAEVDGQEQLLCTQPTRVVAYHPETGEILWYCEGLANLPRGNLVYTSLMLGDGYGVAMGGYNGPSFGFKLGGSGNVTETSRLWHQTQRNPQRIGSGVILDNRLYIANAGPGTAECIDVVTGKQLWQERLDGGNHWGSTIYADGRLYATNQQGTTHVFRPNPEKYEPIAGNSLGEPTNATPAFSDGQIFLRTAKSLFCIGTEAK